MVEKDFSEAGRQNENILHVVVPEPLYNSIVVENGRRSAENTLNREVRNLKQAK